MGSTVQVNNEIIEQAVVASIAGQILNGIDQTVRDAILAKSIEEALRGFSVRHAVEKAVAERAAEIAGELCRGEDWGRRIAETLREGFESYLLSLKRTTTKNWPS